MFLNLFDSINDICYNENFNYNNKKILFNMKRYKNSLVMLPRANYESDKIYIPEMSIPYDNLVFTNHMQVHFKYILRFNERIFIVSHSCFCGKITKDFKPEFPDEQIERMRLYKDEKNDKFIIIPETILDKEILRTGKHAKEYIIKSKWLICSLIKMLEISDNNEIDDEEDGTKEDLEYSKSECVENFVCK